MAKFRVKFDYTIYGVDEFNDDEGNIIVDDYEDYGFDTIVVEAETSHEARRVAVAETYWADVIDIWNVEEV